MAFAVLWAIWAPRRQFRQVFVNQGFRPFVWVKLHNVREVERDAFRDSKPGAYSEQSPDDSCIHAQSHAAHIDQKSNLRNRIKRVVGLDAHLYTLASSNLGGRCDSECFSAIILLKLCNSQLGIEFLHTLLTQASSVPRPTTRITRWRMRRPWKGQVCLCLPLSRSLSLSLSLSPSLPLSLPVSLRSMHT